MISDAKWHGTQLVLLSDSAYAPAHSARGHGGGQASIRRPFCLGKAATIKWGLSPSRARLFGCASASARGTVQATVTASATRAARIMKGLATDLTDAAQSLESTACNPGDRMKKNVLL